MSEQIEVISAETPQVEAEILETEVTEQPAPETQKPDSDKKLTNKLSRQDRKIGQLTAIKHQQAAELEALRKQIAGSQQPQAKSEAPKESDYESYHEYMRALQKHDLEQFKSELSKNGAQEQEALQVQRWAQERTEALGNKAQEFLGANPDAAELLEDYHDLEFPPHIERIFLEADPQETITAFVNLAREGKLEALASMTPTQAAMTIAKASQAKPQVSKAPTPISPARGSAGGGKSLDRMSPDELMAWVNGR